MGIARMPESTAISESTAKEYNKIVLNGETLIDLTADTITAQSLLKGFTAHGADGKKIVGLYEAAAAAGLNATCGEITPTSDQSDYSLSHGLGEVPRAFFIGMQTSYLNLSGKRNILLGAWGMRDHSIQYKMYATSPLKAPAGGVREGAITASGMLCSLTEANGSTIIVADSSGTYVLSGGATYFWVAVGSEK